jgi:hypothetical protein
MEYIKPDLVSSYSVVQLYEGASGFVSACTGSLDDNGVGAACDDGGSI